MALIERGSIDQVIAAADMLEVVGRYTQLKKAGANFTGRCPFHEEKTPSFSVNPVEKLYYCFGCGEGGDLIKFVQQKEGLDFTQAVELLADRFGVELRYEQAPADDAARRRRDRVRQLLEQSCAYYERYLWEAKGAAPVREYLERRGLREEICREYRLGFSPPDWGRVRDRAVAAGFSARELLDAGLVVQRSGGDAAPAAVRAGEAPAAAKTARAGARQLSSASVYDRFRGRLMFPLADERGRVLGFGARTLGDEKPKYVNSPETAVYHKSEAVFGLDKAKDAARRADRVYVVEGYTDVLALAQAGVRNVVACMGTALTEQQVHALMKHTRAIYLCFDADAAGQGAMLRALELARTLGVGLHVVSVPDGLDPAEWVMAGNDAAAFAGLAEGAESLLQFHVRSVLSAHDLAKPDQRARAVTLIRSILAQAPSQLEREAELWHVCKLLGISRETGAELFKGIMPAAAGGGQTRLTPESRARLLTPTRELEARFLAACVARPEEGEKALGVVDETFFADPEMREAFSSVRRRVTQEIRGGNSKTASGESDASEPGRSAPGSAEVLLLAHSEPFSEAMLVESLLNLQAARLRRALADAKSRMGRTSSKEETVRLQEKAREIEKQLRQLNLRDLPVPEQPAGRREGDS